MHLPLASLIGKPPAWAAAVSAWERWGSLSGGVGDLLIGGW